MNAQQLFLIAIGAVCVSGRRLIVFSDVVIDALGGIFDESVFDSFQTSVQPNLYAFQTTALSGLSSQLNLTEGAFAQFAGANNNAGSGSLSQSVASIVASQTPTESTIDIDSDSTATANGAGNTLLQTIGTGTAVFPGSGGSVAGFDFSAFDAETSDNATSNTVVDASGVARDDFAQSLISICAGDNCP
eukprot:TRINITY_DN99_c0_g1_i21.p4 TRINITY_DN99_c0_g1~~TRINITY_DN99_c0_g1_i21.p4  ORF type:complete len:189 (+),score=48.21 TRINITY_DN99_c0_g1_i21:135-701(+)